MAGPGGGGALSCERSVPRQGGRPSSSEELPWPEVDDPGSPREVCWPAEDPHECAAIHLDWFDAGLIAVMSTRGQEHLAASDARALLADPAAWSPSAIAEHSIRRNCRKRDGRLWATARACRSQRHRPFAVLWLPSYVVGRRHQRATRRPGDLRKADAALLINCHCRATLAGGRLRGVVAAIATRPS